MACLKAVTLRTNEDAEQWHYIRTQQDVDALTELFVGFHDPRLDRLTYEEECGKAKLTARFDNSGWFGIIELRFEGLLALNLRPPLENCSREIFSATLLFRRNLFSGRMTNSQRKILPASAPGLRR